MFDQICFEEESQFNKPSNRTACPVDFNDEEAFAASAEIFEVFTIEDCKWCDQAIELLAGKVLPFEKTVLGSRVAQVNFLAQHSLKGIAATFPQIFRNGRRIGGYTELAAEIAA